MWLFRHVRQTYKQTDRYADMLTAILCTLIGGKVRITETQSKIFFKRMASHLICCSRMSRPSAEVFDCTTLPASDTCCTLTEICSTSACISCTTQTNCNISRSNNQFICQQTSNKHWTPMKKTLSNRCSMNDCMHH